MAIEKTTAYNVMIPDAVSDIEKEISVNKVETFMEDGTLVARNNHRSVIKPDSDWSSEPDNVKTQCDLLFTAEIISKYKTWYAALQKEHDEMGAGTLD